MTAKILAAYFSASGVTKKVAEELAKMEQADLFEICPQIPYTKEDLDWRNKQSRSTVEMQGLGCRPPITGQVQDMARAAHGRFTMQSVANDRLNRQICCRFRRWLLHSE